MCDFELTLLIIVSFPQYLRGYNERLQQGAALAEVAGDVGEGCGQTHTG